MTKNIIPTINISTIVKNGYESQSSIKIINKIKKACIDIGFFQITGHGISQKKIKNICNVGNKFFNSSDKNKKNFHQKNGTLKIKIFTEDIFQMM